MKIILAAVVSSDGFITKKGTKNISEWASSEDQQFFELLRRSHKLFVMGSNTYDDVKPKPSEGTLRIVLTSKPEKYKADEVKDRLEFKKLTPMEFVMKYQDKFESCLVLGGSYLYEDFLKNGLADEVILTVEPEKNLEGVQLLASGDSIEKYIDTEPKTSVLNKKGTLLKHYLL